jgi:diacylglycerol kinase (ATP)
VHNITIIVHGRHGLNNLLKDFLGKYSNDAKITTQTLFTKKGGDARQFAKEATEQKQDVIIAAGGDGTINEVINGILCCTQNPPRLMIIPIGTGNDFMLKRSTFSCADQLYKALHQPDATPLDVGKITAENERHYFLNIADAGFGGCTVHTLNRQRKYISGKIAYPIAILTTFLRFTKPNIQFSCGDFSYQGKSLMVAFCNSQSFGSGIIINPDANPSDQLMNITFLGKVSLFDYIRYLPKLKKGKKIEHPELHYITGNVAHIKVLSGSAPFEADGEPVKFKNATITLIPSVLHLIEPTKELDL